MRAYIIQDCTKTLSKGKYYTTNSTNECNSQTANWALFSPFFLKQPAGSSLGPSLAFISARSGLRSRSQARFQLRRFILSIPASILIQTNFFTSLAHKSNSTSGPKPQIQTQTKSKNINKKISYTARGIDGDDKKKEEKKKIEKIGLMSARAGGGSRHLMSDKCDFGSEKSPNRLQSASKAMRCIWCPHTSHEAHMF